MADSANSSKTPTTWKLEITGSERTGAATARRRSQRFDDLLKVEEAQSYRIERSRGGDETPIELELKPDQIVEVELGDGVRWWTTVEELAKAVEPGSERGSGARSSARVEGETGHMKLSGTLGGDLGAERGLGSWAMRGLRVLGVKLLDDVTDEAGRAAALALCAKLETRGELGFRRVRGGQLGQDVIEEPLGSTDGPLLIFLHGTASHFDGSFGDLEPDSFWGPVDRRYPNSVYTFEHRSLTVSPIRNAIDLLELLPADATLHLVSHSRGGLIGELLCRGRFTQGDPGFDTRDFELIDPAYREDLRELDALLRSKRPKVERFLRVACPARGTILASDRLDRTFSLVLNALGMVPRLAGSFTYDMFEAVFLALLETRSKPADLPGLETMRPSSRFIAMLQRDGRQVDADLTVVAGDIERAGILQRMLVLGTDVFFREDHDLVVNTASMYGGTPRRLGRSRFSFERSRETQHFTYFERRSSQILQALVGLGAAGGTDPFQTLDMGGAPPVRRGLVRAPEEIRTDRPVVVVLPGVMGSRLRAGSNVIWLDADDLIFGGLEELSADRDVSTAGLIASTYEPLVEHLSSTHEVVEQDFDWRLGLKDQASKLLGTLEKLLGRTDRSIRLIAHSMGGVLALTSMLDDVDQDGVWDRLRQRSGFRLVFLGTPCYGSHVIPAIVFAREKILRWLHRIDIEHTRNEVLDIVRDFQGLYDLLPSYDKEAGDIFQETSWKGWRDWDDDDWPVPDGARLAQAKALRDDLDRLLTGLVDRFGDNALAYVAGLAEETPYKIRQRDAKWWRSSQLDLVATRRGDGRVTWEHGPPPQVRVWFAKAKHGALPKFEDAWPAYDELLAQGNTNLLPRSSSVRGETMDVSWRQEALGTFPTVDELVAAAMGDDVSLLTPPDQPSLYVQATHGDLQYAKYPVLVGHYEDDDLYSAEAALDGILDGRLRKLHRLGLYPGPEGSWEIVEHPLKDGVSAVIVGLGRVGELSPGRIERVARLAAMRTALHFEAKGDASAGLSAVLMGSGEGTGLSVRDSVRQLVSGVRLANRDLAEGGSSARICSFEIIELYQDRALRAAHAARELSDVGTGLPGPPIEASAVLHWAAGGVKRLFEEENDGWWRRLQISAAEVPVDVPIRERPLVFEYLSDRARTPQEVVATQRRLAEEFVRSAIGSASWDRRAAETLFEMLVPRRLKDYAPDQRDLVLVLDDEAASYPWELMEDPFSSRPEPMAVRSGMVRQLKTKVFRLQVHHPTARQALVVGDPPSHMPRLDGALEEARQVAKLLREHGWEVDLLERPSTHEILRRLFTEPYRVIHIAAHGVWNEVDRHKGGIVIGDHRYLTPGDLDQMRRVPELFFVNCCHLGRIEAADMPDSSYYGYRNHLAASVGAQLIRMGARAVVAAGWVVDDRAAQGFADVMYRSLLGGSDFGRAVKSARSRTYHESRHVNTWGAYQCYGDPGFVVDERGSGGSWGRTFRPVAADEVVIELRGLASRATVGDDLDALTAKIQNIETLLVERHGGWLARADIRAALGEAYSEVAELHNLAVLLSQPGSSSPPDGNRQGAMGRFDAFEAAVEHLRQSLASDRGLLERRAPRLLARLRMRRAVFAWRYPTEMKKGASRRDAARTRRQAAEEEVNEVLDELIILARIDLSLWMQCELGEALRRRAQLRRSDSARLGDLIDATHRFERAHEQAQVYRGSAGVYPTLGWALTLLVGSFLHRKAKGSVADATKTFWEDVDRSRIPEWLETARQQVESARTFWQRAALGDIELGRLLLAALDGPDDGLRSALEALAETMVERYAEAMNSASSPRQKATKIEEIDWLLDLLMSASAEPGGAMMAVEDEPDLGAESADRPDRRALLRSVLLAARQRLVTQVA